MIGKYVVLSVLSIIAIIVNFRYVYLIVLAYKSNNAWEYASEGGSMLAATVISDVLLLSVLMSK